MGKRISDPEEDLFAQIRIKRLPLPEREYRFFAHRQWRFDFAWSDPKIMLAVEVEGGAYAGGRHTRGTGFENDAEKYNFATLLGWRLLRFTAKQIKNWSAVGEIKVALVGGFNILNAPRDVLPQIVVEGMELRYK
jgi:very-short-patch-repair endonuclease